MRRSLLGASALLLGLLALPPAGVTAGTEGTGTVRAVVRYETPEGKEPLAGVEVWLGIDLGGSPINMLGCSDEHGVVRFRGVPADTDLMSATGAGNCPNARFLNPDTGNEMTVVTWDDHHGELVFDGFAVAEAETTTVRFVVQTPDQDGQLCRGYWSTWAGRAGADRFSGTPESDVANARGGDDTIRTGGGLDLICGGAGDDTLRGGGGDDWLFGESGDDELLGGPGSDSVDGGPGRDRCRGEERLDCE